MPRSKPRSEHAPPRADPVRRALLRGLCAGLPWWGAGGARAAEAAELRIVAQAAGEAGAQITAALSRRFPGAQRSDSVQALAARSGPGVYLAIGPQALQSALEAELTGPLVSAFVSAEAYQRLVGAAAPRRTRPVTAVYAEASPAAQMQLIRALYRRRVAVGVLLSAATRHLRPLIEQAARAADLTVAFELVEAGANPVRALSALSSATVLLAVPDPELYNAQVARAILESAYRRRQGVIGFSRAMVAAGTLGAAYASIDDVVAQLEGLLASLPGGQPAGPQYPLYWRVAINDSVARSLDVVVDDGARALGNFPG